MVKLSKKFFSIYNLSTMSNMVINAKNLKISLNTIGCDVNKLNLKFTNTS
jgi:hypothetical protein